VQRLYQVLEHLGVHVTIRDMLIHLAYTVTGGLDCDRVQGQPPLHWEPQRHVYYENVWGEAADEHFRRKAVVIRHLRRLNVGQMSVFEVDDFIINGRPADPAAQAEHERLFAPALDLGGRRFGQERAAYLYGGATAPRPEEEHPLMQWLPHCRRKLFFEWQETTAADRLFPFTATWKDNARAILSRHGFGAIACGWDSTGWSTCWSSSTSWPDLTTRWGRASIPARLRTAWTIPASPVWVCAALSFMTIGKRPAIPLMTLHANN
jgi:hypothetical protein